MNGDNKMDREAILTIELPMYNRAMEHQHRAAGMLGELHDCQHCGRKYNVCCICDKAEKDWNNMILEVRGVHDAIKNDIADDDKESESCIAAAADYLFRRQREIAIASVEGKHGYFIPVSDAGDCSNGWYFSYLIDNIIRNFCTILSKEEMISFCNESIDIVFDGASGE